jgi:TolB-like protein
VAAARRETSTPARQPSREQQRSIAVLPFVNMSSDRENEFLSDGISEDLLNALSWIEGLRVAASTSCLAIKGHNEDIRKIGGALGVETVLEGCLRRVGTKLRITAQLVNVADGFRLWSERSARLLRFRRGGHCRHPAHRIWRLNSAGIRISDRTRRPRVPEEDRHHIIPATDFQRGRQPFHHCEGRRRASGVPHRPATSRGCASPALLRREGSRQ